MNEFNEKTAETNSSVKCKDCGANINFQPGTVFLTSWERRQLAGLINYKVNFAGGPLALPGKK